jgi:hypothetical protein
VLTNFRDTIKGIAAVRGHDTISKSTSFLVETTVIDIATLLSFAKSLLDAYITLTQKNRWIIELTID